MTKEYMEFEMISDNLSSSILQYCIAFIFFASAIITKQAPVQHHRYTGVLYLYVLHHFSLSLPCEGEG